MTIDLTCQKCEAGFELDAQDLLDGTEKLECPHCGAKAPSNLAEDFIAALSEMRLQVANLGKKFAISMALESDEVEEDLEGDDDEEDDDLDYDDEDEDDDEEDDDEDDDDDELEDEVER